MNARTLVCCILLSFVVTAPVDGQSAEEARRNLYSFEILPDRSVVSVAANDFAEITIRVRDLSRDNTGGFTNDGAGVGPHVHQTLFSFTDDTQLPIGWGVTLPGVAQTRGGESAEVTMRVQATQQAREPFVEFGVVARTNTLSGPFFQVLNFSAWTEGPNTFSATPVGSLQLGPGDVQNQVIRITNGRLLPREFGVEVTQNSCGLTTAYDAVVIVGPRETTEAFLTVRGPTGKFWYNSELCQMQVTVHPLDQPQNQDAMPLSIQVQGFYINPVWVFWILAAGAATLIVVMVVRRRKALIEEEILGKPQRPWTIPVERVYLEHLEAKDPRAAYVVRHFLMEEEYASALLWYKHYKQATRGERAKESMVVRQEKRYDRFTRSWEKRIAAPLKQADKYEAQLQKRLDREAKKDVRKARRKWKKLVAKLEEVAEAQNAKALAKWEKATAKAEKKGNPAPPKPELLSPDLPPEPQLQKIELADHKWNKKAIRFRKKMVKRQGDLEVKFEKKDARLLHKLRKKVQKVARKLDDPDFVDEHPLLARPAE